MGPDDLNLSVFGDGEQVISRSLFGVSIEEMYSWLEEELRKFPGGPQEIVLARPEYDLPHHPVVDGEYFYGGDDDAALPELTRWYHNASALLQRLRADEPHATPVRCWPHHFDIATLIVLDPEIGATKGRSVGVGFSPGDGSYTQPYWYVTPYPNPEDPQLTDLPSGGHWHTEGWFGAVLTGGRIVEAGDPAAQSRRVSDFVQVAVQTTKGLLADFIDFDELDKWRDFGGVRNEEDFLITADGFRRLGPYKPQTVEEIESLRDS